MVKKGRGEILGLDNKNGKWALRIEIKGISKHMFLV